MSTRPYAPPLARGNRWLGWAFAGAAAAVSVGAAAAFSGRIALAIVIAIAVAIAVALRPSLVLLLLIASVFTEVITLGGVTISRIVAPVALLVVIAGMLRGTARIRWRAPLGWATVYALWAFASCFWTIDFDATTFYLGSLALALIYLLAFATLLNTEQDLRRVLAAASLGALVIGLYALADFLAVGGRSAGAKGDPNSFAAFQILVLPMALVLAAEAKKRWMQLLMYLAVVVIAGSVLTSLSRGGLLTLAGIALLALIAPARSIFRSGQQKVLVLCALLAGAITAFVVASNLLLPRLESAFTTGDNGSGRLIEWEAALTAYRGERLHGIGFGAFNTTSNSFILETPNISLEGFELRENGSLAHSIYIGSMADLGIVGLILVIGLFVSTAVLLWRTGRQARKAGNLFVMRVANALLLSLGSWAVASLFLSTETSRPFWILMGMALALPKLIKTPPGPRPPPRSPP